MNFLIVLPTSFLEIFITRIFKVFIRFGVVDEMMQTAPGAFERFEIFVVQDEIDLLGKLAVDLRDHGASMVLMASSEMSVVAARACSASVCTAVWTALSLRRSWA